MELAMATLKSWLHALMHLHRISAWTNPHGHTMDIWCHDCGMKFYPSDDTERGKTSKEPRANRKPGHPWDEPLQEGGE